MKQNRKNVETLNLKFNFGDQFEEPQFFLSYSFRLA